MQDIPKTRKHCFHSSYIKFPSCTWPRNQELYLKLFCPAELCFSECCFEWWFISRPGCWYSCQNDGLNSTLQQQRKQPLHPCRVQMDRVETMSRIESLLTPANVNSPWSIPLCKSWYSGNYFFLGNMFFSRTMDFICWCCLHSIMQFKSTELPEA